MQYKTNIQRSASGIDVSYVASILSDVFGIAQPVYHPSTDNGTTTIPAYTGIEIEQDFLQYDKAPLRYGQKTFGAFWLKGGTYKSWNHKGELIANEYNDLLMPLATIVAFDRPKVVTKTPVSTGTVKEIWGLDDWQISIDGLIFIDKFNPDGQVTVQDQMDAIQRFHEVAGAVEVEGQKFAVRGISAIVTESLKFEEVQGRPGLIKYSISAVSDEDILLKDIV